MRSASIPKGSTSQFWWPKALIQGFFNIIHLFSRSIPLIAVQVNMVEVNGVKSLHFSKIIDTYQEPEEPDVPAYKGFNEGDWTELAPWTVEAAKTLLGI